MVTMSEDITILKNITRNIEQGLYCHRKGNFDEAETIYREVLGLDPNQPDALHLLGVLTHSRGNSSASVELISKAISIRPKFPEAYCNLGVSLEALNRLPESVTAFKEALNIKPNYMEAYFNLGNLHLKLDEPDAAIINYETALKINPDNVDIILNLGNAWSAKGDHTKAISYYKSALKIDPSSAEAYVNLGNSLKDSGDLTNAIYNLKCALQLQPHLGAIHMKIGKIFSDQNNLKAAIKCFQDGVRLLPDDFDAHLILGQAFATLGDLKSAIGRIKRSLKLNPTLEVGYYEYFRIAAVSASDPILHKARKLLKSAKISDAGRMYLNFALGYAELKLGEESKAMGYLIKANAIRKEYSDYDIRIDEELFKSIKKYFGKTNLEKLDRKSVSSAPRPIFIVGMPSSRAILLEQIISSHPKIYSGGELAFLKEAIDKTAWKTEKDKGRIFTDIRVSYLQKLSLVSDSSIITDIMGLNFRWIGFIIESLPEAKIIHIKHSAPAICWSTFKTFFAADGLKFAFDLEDIGKYYALYDNIMDFWHKKYPEKIFDVDDEGLNTNFFYNIEGLFEFLELHRDSDTANFYNTDLSKMIESYNLAHPPKHPNTQNDWIHYKKWLTPMLNILDDRKIEYTS